MNPDSAKNEIATEALAAVNRGLREQAHVEHRLLGAPLPGHERRRQHCGQREAAERPRASPAVVRGLDDRVDEQPDCRGRQREPGPVGAGRVRVTRGRDVAGDQDTGAGGDRHHREEDAAPVGELEQPAADDRSERDRHARDRAPQADRPGALAPLGEHVGDQRQRRGEHHRRTDAHHRARRDQRAGAVRQPAGQARETEDRQAGEQHPLAPEAVRQAARGQHRSGEQQVERVHDPLQLRVGRVQLAHERRQRDVDDRRVEIDHKRRQQQRDQDQGPAFHDSSSGWLTCIMQGRLGETLAFVKQVSYDWSVLQRDYPDQVCSIARSLEVVGERWTLLILRDALVGLTRFEEFQDEARDCLQRPHQPAQAAVRRGAARTRSGPGAARPAEVRPHRQGTRARARPDRADEMGRPPLPDPGRPTPTHPPRRLRRQHRPRPPLRPVRQTRGARGDRAPPRPGGATRRARRTVSIGRAAGVPRGPDQRRRDSSTRTSRHHRHAVVDLPSRAPTSPRADHTCALPQPATQRSLAQSRETSCHGLSSETSAFLPIATARPSTT